MPPSRLTTSWPCACNQAVTRADCREEYLVVLHYKHLPLDEHSRPGAAARFDALITVVAPAAKLVRLPVCTDKDDQKFLEISRDADAEILITKDKALLKLARKTAQASSLDELLFSLIVLGDDRVIARTVIAGGNN